MLLAEQPHSALYCPAAPQRAHNTGFISSIFEPPAFAELHARSNFTFLVGASNPEEMVVRAAAKLSSGLALTDECSVSGVVRAHLAAHEASVHFICGSEMLLTTHSGHPHARVVFLAQSSKGRLRVSSMIGKGFAS